MVDDIHRVSVIVDYIRAARLRSFGITHPSPTAAEVSTDETVTERELRTFFATSITPEVLNGIKEHEYIHFQEAFEKKGARDVKFRFRWPLLVEGYVQLQAKLPFILKGASDLLTQRAKESELYFHENGNRRRGTIEGVAVNMETLFGVYPDVHIDVISGIMAGNILAFDASNVLAGAPDLEEDKNAKEKDESKEDEVTPSTISARRKELVVKKIRLRAGEPEKQRDKPCKVVLYARWGGEPEWMRAILTDADKVSYKVLRAWVDQEEPNEVDTMKELDDAKVFRRLRRTEMTVDVSGAKQDAKIKKIRARQTPMNDHMTLPDKRGVRYNFSRPFSFKDAEERKLKVEQYETTLAKKIQAKR